jgi:hypothetical protein
MELNTLCEIIDRPGTFFFAVNRARPLRAPPQRLTAGEAKNRGILAFVAFATKVPSVVRKGMVTSRGFEPKIAVF